MTQATAFDPFKGFGPKIKIRKTGDHGQRNDQRAREMYEVPGDQHRPGAEERERGDGAGADVVCEVLDTPQGDEPEAEAPGGDPEVGVDDPRWFQRAGEHPWPAKFTRFRPDQLTATEQIIEAYESGAKVVMLDAPTGSGKTLAAEMVRRRLGVKGVYVCSGKQLQDQVCADFGDYARVLKGRSNYPTATMPYPEYTGDDCTGRGCRFCPTRAECPYQHAKVQAMTATVGVLNTSYLLAEANTAGTFGEKEVKGRMTRRPFVVVDECVPGDTMVATPFGPIRIDKILPGQMIWGERDGKLVATRVEAVSEKESDEPFVHVGSTRLTPSHPVWTEGGYVPAGDLNRFEAVTVIDSNYGTDFLRVVSRQVQAEGEVDQVLLSLLPLEVELVDQPKEDGRGFILSPDRGAQESQTQGVAARSPEPALRPEGQGKSGDDSTGEGVRPPEWWEWDQHAFTGSGPDSRSRGGMGVGTSSGYWQAYQDAADLLQDRHSSPTLDGRDRSGWGRSSFAEREASRWPQRSVADGERVASDAVHKQASESRPEDVCGLNRGPRRVYNLKTSTGNYFANDLLVHNCDTLESALMGYVEFRASARLLEDLGLQPPVKAARTKTVQAWIGSLVSALEVRVEAMQDWDENDVALMRRKRGITRVLDQARGIELGNDEDPDGWGDWIRVYETKWDPKAREERDVPSFVLKPVVVNDWGMERLWRHSDKWLIMSATIISPDEMAESLGLDQAGVPWAVVRMPMPFAKENRPIVMKPVANITYQEAAVEKPKMLAGIAEILDRYEDENILVHTVSYSLTKYLADGLLKERQKGRWNRERQILAYSNAKERDAAVEAFNRTGGVLLAPSLDRGLDLPDDLCRVVIVAKVPFPALGDRQVSERLRRPGGQVWYGVQVARSLVQMTGRGVRHENDWATTFILDKQFPRWYREAGRKLLPDWWIEAITSDTKQ